MTKTEQAHVKIIIISYKIVDFDWKQVIINILVGVYKNIANVWWTTGQNKNKSTS
jgi:hypothetical protein